ncbi:MAG: hypothetical protein AVDCRST_MAG30-546, partial [uncultured Solirubrobacteraceae bacterium]
GDPMHPSRPDPRRPSGARRGVRGVPEDRRLVDAPARVPDLREDRLLRRLAQPPRDRPRARDGASDHPLRRARRGLVLLLSRRARVRRALRL